MLNNIQDILSKLCNCFEKKKFLINFRIRENPIRFSNVHRQIQKQPVPVRKHSVFSVAHMTSVIKLAVEIQVIELYPKSVFCVTGMCC